MGVCAPVGVHAELLPAPRRRLGSAGRAGRALLAAAVPLTLAACPAGGPGGAAGKRPGILLVSVDSLRADHTDGVAAARPTGPRLRELAESGAVFTQATAPAPWTTPSMASVLTGLFPWSHHVREHDFALAPEVLLLSERLRKAGYATAAVVPSATLAEEHGFSRGFDFYWNGRYDHRTVTSPAMTGLALDWLERNASGPFFCWIHYWDPHFDYLPPPPWNEAFPSGFTPPTGTIYDLAGLKNRRWPLRPEEAEHLAGQYDGEILYTDRYIGELLDFLDARGLRERTLVVLLADHGEGFQEHGWLTHTMAVYEEMIRVPLLLRWPGRIGAGARFDRPVSLVDVAPTILDYAGVAAPEGAMEGRSLRPLIESRAGEAGREAPERPIVSETVRQSAVASLRRGDWKYILDFETCAGELYDLSSDPGENREQSREQPAKAAEMKRTLIEFYADTRRSGRSPVVRIEDAGSERREQLRSLGYIAADRFGDVLPPVQRADPLGCR